MASDRSVPEDEIEVTGSVLHYHRTDRYRVVMVTAPNAKFLEELGRKVEAEFVRRELHSIYVHLEVCHLQPIKKHRLEVAIWPRAGKPLTVEWH
jgi:GTP cyclohydrolase FolE2